MQHALSELSNFVYFSSTSSLSLPQSQAQQNHSQKSHTHCLTHTASHTLPPHTALLLLFMAVAS